MTEKQKQTRTVKLSMKTFFQGSGGGPGGGPGGGGRGGAGGGGEGRKKKKWGLSGVGRGNQGNVIQTPCLYCYHTASAVTGP